MEPLLIEVKSGIDLFTYHDFMQFMRTGKKGYKIRPAVSFLLCIAAGLFFALMMRYGNDSFNFIFTLLFIFSSALSIALLYLYFLHPMFSPPKDMDLLDAEITCRFFENHLEAVVEGEGVSGTNTYQYNFVKAVYEVKTAFYFTFYNGSAVLLEKADMEYSQIAYLCGFLAYRFGKRYINCN